MADVSKITGTYKNSKLTITKVDPNTGGTLKYDSTVSDTTLSLSTADGTYANYGSDVSVIDASALSAKMGIEVTSPEVTTFTGGKGADTLVATGNVSFTGGNGKDVIVITSDTSSVTISDYTANQDVIQIKGLQDGGAKFSAPTGSADTSNNVYLGFTNGDDEINLTLKNANGKRITVVDESNNVVIDQPFQRGDLILTNANSGSVINSNADVINASARSTGFQLTVNANEDSEGQVVTLGKGNDTLIALTSASYTLGKGNDYVVINTDVTKTLSGLSIEDFAVGEVGKNGDRIVLGAGISTYSTSDDGSITFSDTVNEKTFTLSLGENVVWDQIKPEAKNQVIIVENGTEKGLTIKDENLYVVPKITDKTKTTIQLNSGDYTAKDGSTEKNAISFETTSLALDITAAEVDSDSAMTAVTAGSGKDTLSGASSSAAPPTSFDGGKGNDLLIGNVKGGTFYGGDGVDTLRSGAKDATVRAGLAVAGGTPSYGSTDLYGEAGNDVFVLTGEGSAIINDYTNVTGTTAADKAVKKVMGTDKIVIANDKWNTKGATTQAYLAGGTVDSDGDLKLTVSGKGYVDTVAASLAITEADKSGSKHVIGTFDSDTKAMTVNTAKGLVSVAGDFVVNTTATYTIVQNTIDEYDEDEEPLNESTKNAITVTDQGITYTQDAFDAANYSSEVKVTGNYHTALNPYALNVDGSASKKAMRLVALTAATGKGTYSENDYEYSFANLDADTKITLQGGGKADTLISGTNASLNGGAGNDVFWVKGDSAVIADYGGKADGSGTEKDKIYVDASTNAFNQSVSIDGKDLKFGNITIANAAGYTANGGISLNYDDTLYKVNNKGVITGTAKDSHSMVRDFTAGSTVVAAGAGSTDLYTYTGDVDSGVALVNLSKGKGVNLTVNSTAVASILGGAKADTINYSATFDGTFYKTDGTGTKNYSDTALADASAVSVTTGKGNDVIIVNNGNKLYVTDFQASTINTATKAFKAGDALNFAAGTGTNVYASDVTAASTTLGEKDSATGRKIQGTDSFKVTFNGSNVIINGVELANMKDKNAYIWTDQDATNTAEGALATLSNLAAFTIDKSNNKTYAKGAAVITGSLGTAGKTNVDESDVYIIDASAITNGAKIDAGSYVTNITAGKGVDTIYAGYGLNAGLASPTSETTITAGAGADYIVFQADKVAYGANVKYTITDYASDKLFFDGLAIKSAEVDGGGQVITAGKRAGQFTTSVVSDITLTVANVEDSSKTFTVVLSSQADTTGFKVTTVDGLGKNAATKAVTYGQSDITVANTDGNIIDLTGAGDEGKLNVNIGATRTKAVTVENAPASTANIVTSIIGTASKAAITYVDNGEAGDKVTFYGSSKADIYEGHGSSDTVIFSAGGNNTVMGGGKATITLSTAAKTKEVVYTKASDTFTLATYTPGEDTIVLDTVYGTAAQLLNADYVQGATAGKGTLTLTFGTAKDANTNAEIKLTDYTAGNKITIQQGSLNTKTKKIAATALLQMGFGADVNVADADVAANKSTINGGLVKDATAIIGTAAKKAMYLTVGDYSDTKVTAITGGAGNDTIVANYGIVNLTGGKGADTFVLSSETNIAIADFNTLGGKDVLDFKTAGNTNLTKFKVEDYGANYSFNGKDLILKTEAGSEITLTGVVDETKGVTSAIRYNGADDQSKNGVTLHNKVNITLSGGNSEKTDFTADYFSDTVTFDATKATALTKFKAGDVFTTFKASKNGSEVNLSGDSKEVTYVGGAGADKVTLGSGKTTFTFAGGADELTNVVKDKYSISVAAGYTADSAKVSTDQKEVTLSFKKGRADGGSIKLTATDATAFTFDGSWVKDESSAASLGGSGADSSTTVYTWYYNRTVEIAGVSGKFVYDSSSKVEKQKDAPTSAPTAAYMEQFAEEYAPIVAPETLFGGSAFEEITANKVAVDTGSTATNEVDYSVKTMAASSVVDKLKKE